MNQTPRTLDISCLRGTTHCANVFGTEGPVSLHIQEKVYGQVYMVNSDPGFYYKGELQRTGILKVAKTGDWGRPVEGSYSVSLGIEFSYQRVLYEALLEEGRGREPFIIPPVSVGHLGGDVDYILFPDQGLTSLVRVVNSNNGLDWIRVVDILSDLCGIFSVYHDMGYLHGDVKSENVLLDEDFVPKIGDFGLARRIRGPQLVNGASKGTIRYMAPEQLEGVAITEKIDVYAIAAVGVEMLINYRWNREIPETHIVLNNVDPILEYVRSGAHQDYILSLERHAPKIMLDILAKCMDKDPEKRPSMSELETELRRIPRRVLYQLLEAGYL